MTEPTRYWTPTLHPVTAELVGLSTRLEGRDHPLQLEYGGLRRLRVARGNEPLIWARVLPRHEGLWVVRRRGPRELGVLPPIRADDARTRRTSVDWMKWVANGLQRSETPLRAGEWQLTDMYQAPPSLMNRVRGELPDAYGSREPDHLPSPAFGVRDALRVPNVSFQRWCVNGSARVLPLRDPSPPDAGRVKAWRKHARKGTLPPLVLWWVSAFDMHVLVDGHDRLQAAVAEDVAPHALVLWQAREEPSWSSPEWRHEMLGRYQRAFMAEDRLSLRRRLGLNASLVEAFRTYRRVGTRARARASMGAEWAAEVRAELADDPAAARRVCDE